MHTEADRMRALRAAHALHTAAGLMKDTGIPELAQDRPGSSLWGVRAALIDALEVFTCGDREDAVLIAERAAEANELPEQTALGFRDQERAEWDRIAEELAETHAAVQRARKAVGAADGADLTEGQADELEPIQLAYYDVRDRARDAAVNASRPWFDWRP